MLVTTTWQATIQGVLKLVCNNLTVYSRSKNVIKKLKKSYEQKSQQLPLFWDI